MKATQSWNRKPHVSHSTDHSFHIASGSGMACKSTVRWAIEFPPTQGEHAPLPAQLVSVIDLPPKPRVELAVAQTKTAVEDAEEEVAEELTKMTSAEEVVEDQTKMTAAEEVVEERTKTVAQPPPNVAAEDAEEEVAAVMARTLGAPAAPAIVSMATSTHHREALHQDETRRTLLP